MELTTNLLPARATLLSLLMTLGGLSPMPVIAQSVPTDSNASARQPVAAAPWIEMSEVGRDLAAFAADPLRARATPSAALDTAASYVAAEFQRLGLETEVQKYPIPGQQQVNVEASRLDFHTYVMRNGKPVVDDDGQRLPWQIHTELYFAPGIGRQTIKRRQLYFGNALTLLAGHYTTASVRQLADTLRNRVVLYVPPADTDSAAQRQVITELYGLAQGVIVVGASDPKSFAAEQTRAPGAELFDDYMKLRKEDHNPWAVVTSGAQIGELLTVIGEDLERLREADIPVMKPLNPHVFPIISGKAATAEVARAPNVVGILRGSDSVSALRGEFVFIVAPLDTRCGGVRQGAADHVDSCAGDAASAMAGLLALARAFTQPGNQPRRSIVFLAASGGTRDEFWGANYFIKQWQGSRGRAVALAMDQLDGWPGDSVLANGLREVNVAPSLNWVAASHPELGLRVVDGGTAAQRLADHFAFFAAAIPSLYVHAAVRSPTAVAAAEHVKRGAQLIFYLTQAMANADQPPGWSAEGRRQRRSVLGS